MELTEREVGTIIVLDLGGRLTLEHNNRLKDKVSSLIFQGRKQIVLNLARLEYMDSAGLGEVVACASTASKNGGAVKLANTTKRVKDLLTITKLLTVFESYDSEAAALESFVAS